MIKPTDACAIVTGASGMIGRALTTGLTSRGIKMICVCRERGRLPDHPLITTVLGDLLTAEVGEKAFEVAKRQHDTRSIVVVHLAGMSSAGDSRARPFDALQNNTLLTARVLDLACRHRARRFLFTSTGAVYASGRAVPVDETDLPAPSSFYASTKLAAEALCQGASAEWGMPCEIVRIANVYGPNSREHTVFGRILAQARNREAIAVRSRRPIRDFIHIDDVVEGLVRLIMAAESGCHITNLSTALGTSVGELADVVAAAAGTTSAVDNGSEGNDDLVLANHRLYSRTGWRPQIGIREGVRLVLESGKEIA